MTRRLLRWVLVVAATVLVGCGDENVAATAENEEAAVTTRGRHRVRQSSRSQRNQATAAVEVDVPRIEVAVLDRQESPFVDGRDPFRYGQIERPKPRPKPAPPPREKPKPAPVQNREPAKVRPTPPPFSHTYLGSFGPMGLRIAVFEDAEGGIINAFEGEVLEGKFKVLKIGYESVDIEFVGFPDTPAERREIGG